MIRYLFLDFGNTLVHEVPSRFEIYAQAARELGAEIDEGTMRGVMVRAHAALPEEIEGHWRYTDPWFRSYIRAVFREELGLEPADWDAFHARLFARFADPATFRLFPGAHELFAAVRAAGIGLGVISNWSPRLPGLVESLGLNGLFEPLVCSAIERLEKPSRDIFELALDRAGVAPEDGAHAGDHLDKDCRAASELGLHAILVDHADEHGERALAHPRVTSLMQLKDYVLEHQ